MDKQEEDYKLRMKLNKIWINSIMIFGIVVFTFKTF